MMNITHTIFITKLIKKIYLTIFRIRCDDLSKVLEQKSNLDICAYEDFLVSLT